ncbi:MAG TPA: hypothetical protein VK208_01485 [Pyrinomonadaceae bacterium]|nr:hypothetical protein [Pyrinomonadaceae bacterium]
MELTTKKLGTNASQEPNMLEVRIAVTAASSRIHLLLPLIVTCVFLSACSSSNRPIAEAPPAAVSTSPTEQTRQAPKNLSPPELKTVEAAVRRVFKDAAAIDNSRNPAFIAGDFNGDLSEDIAIVVKPVPEKIAEMNQEFPAWLLRDPFGSLASRSPRLAVTVSDQLLAIIHGYGDSGWRDPQATQTYLLKNAVGSGMETHSPKELVSANPGKPLPRLRGDTVGETIQGKTGYLYYADATYSWYDPNTFAGEPEPRRGHGDQKLKQ